MDHVAIMKKTWGLIPKILSGEKTIESRWYKARIAPWERIKVGDTVYFKNSGESVTVVADVKQVLQFDNLNKDFFEYIVSRYADQICLVNRDYESCYREKRYCILIFLERARLLEQPFDINKSGFGMSCAWIVVEDIEKIKKGFVLRKLAKS